MAPSTAVASRSSSRNPIPSFSNLRIANGRRRSAPASPVPSMVVTNIKPSTYQSTERGQDRVRKNGGNKDIEVWQFWPHNMQMGSLTGKRFTYMFGSQCKHGPDPANNLGYGYSFLAFDFKREMLVIKSQFKTTLPFGNISKQGIHVKEERRADGAVNLIVTVTCRCPPKFFAPMEQGEDSRPDNHRRPRQAGIVYRRRATAMDFVISDTKERYAGVLPSVPDGAVGNPTYWNTYRWTFTLSPQEVTLFRKCANNLRLLSEDDPDMDLMSEHPPELRDKAHRDNDWRFPDLRRLDFETQALIEGLVGNSILIPGDAVELVAALNVHAPGKVFRCHLLETLFTEERIRHPAAMVEARASFLRREITVRNVDHLVRIRSVQVTPTRVLVNPPQEETSNSVTRKYADCLDGIIRVQFVDERDKLHILDYTKKADMICPDVGLMARIRRALEAGIMIAGQRFHPVASSSSQQKEHSMWFVNHQVIDRIALSRWMGMPNEKVVAKYAARMGLPFSATRSVAFRPQVTRCKDIERLGQCFTDGCSVAGAGVMREAAAALNAKGINKTPSAIQFRLGGAKGVLAHWPGMAAENEIRLRPSQEKFSSRLEELNVIRVSHYQVGFLNRQFIMIMSALGLPDDLFMELFENEVKSIRGLTDRVREKRPSEKDIVYLGIYTSFPLNLLIKSGFNTNPFVLDLCHLIETRALQDLKWRARIRLTDSVYLIGISDETGLLKEGELFCQYQKDEKSEPVVVTGKVLICRAPALHPGDVRRAVAVDHPRLCHLKNVIVFNTAGPRPLPNMLGGGDLDGDDYTLIWDQRFVRLLKEHEPMDYTAPKPKTVEKVQQEDLNENFVQYILNDVLGQVDNAHLANSDITSPFNEICLKLSEVHSAAVDFAKTGIAVDVDPEWFPKKWPDFMGKNEEKTYLSPKILGILFRQVHPVPNWDPSNITELDYPVDHRFSTVTVCPELIEALIPVKARFEQAMAYTMRRYRVNETEVVAGIAIQTKLRKTSRDLNHLVEPLKDAFESHTHSAREEALEVALAVARRYNLNFPSPHHTVALHAYVMTYMQEHVEDYEARLLLNSLEGMRLPGTFMMDMYRPSPMLSFAWVWANELVEYAKCREMEMAQRFK